MDDTLKRGNVSYIVYLLLINLGFGFSFILIKELMNVNYPIFLLIALRFAIGSFSLHVFKMFKPQRISRKEVFSGCLLGAFLFLGFVFQTTGAALTTPAKNGLFTGLYVIFVPIIVMIAKKEFRWKPLALSLFCFVGVVFISNVFSDIAINTGDLLTIACALAFALHFVFTEKYAPTLNPINFTLIQLTVVALASSLISIATETNLYSIVKMDKYMMIVIFLGLVETGLCLSIQTHIQSKIKADVIAVISCMESVFAVMFAIIFGYDMLTLSLILGAIIIVSSMIISATSKHKLIDSESNRS